MNNDCQNKWTIEDYAFMFLEIAHELEHLNFSGKSIFNLNKFLFQEVYTRATKALERIAENMQGGHCRPDCFKRAMAFGYEFHAARPFQWFLTEDDLEDMDDNQKFVLSHFHEIVTILFCFGLTQSDIPGYDSFIRPRYYYHLHSDKLKDLFSSYRRQPFSMEGLRHILQMATQLVRTESEHAAALAELHGKIQKLCVTGSKGEIDELTNNIKNLMAECDHFKWSWIHCQQENKHLQELLNNHRNSASGKPATS